MQQFHCLESLEMDVVCLLDATVDLVWIITAAVTTLSDARRHAEVLEETRDVGPHLQRLLVEVGTLAKESYNRLDVSETTRTVLMSSERARQQC